MRSELFFQLAVIGLVISMALISGTYRARARKNSGVIPRSREGLLMGMVRLVFALVLYLPILAFMINPRWMAWSQLNIPGTVRWVGVALGVAVVPGIFSVFRSIGANISETVLTKSTHQLVTSGIYTRIRHPLYAMSGLALAAITLIMSNWFVAGMSFVSILLLLILIVPKEEAELVKRFGNEYESYRLRSGRLFPRIFVRT